MDPNLLKRIITAVFGIVCILALIIFGKTWGVTFLALVGACGALFEYFVMLFPKEEQGIQRVVGGVLGFVLSAFIIFRAGILYESVSVFFIVIFLFYVYLIHTSQDEIQKLVGELAYSLMGVFYVSFLFSFWPKVRELEAGVYWIFLVFLIPWVSDTAAYFVGRKWGQRKLSSVISPHKTIEGAVGGILAAVMGVFLYRIFVFHELTWISCVILGVGGAVLSQVGDLFESLLKRALAVKDSGVVIPGHGGILDRFDSVLFCAPFIYFYARLI